MKPYGSKTSKKANYCNCCTSFARQEKKHVKRRERLRAKEEIKDAIPDTIERRKKASQ